MENKLNAYVLLDRSGSMANKWQETLSSVNVYAKELKDAEITVVTFDHHAGLQFDTIRNKVAVEDYKDITDKEASPRGGTPLLDAIARLVAVAKTANVDKTIIVVMTDGQENQSTEVTKEKVKVLLDECKAKNWEVIFLGADFNAMNNASLVGIDFGKTLNMTTGNYVGSMRSLGEKTAMYASANTAVAFSAQDRTEASK